MEAAGHLTEVPAKSMYSGVISFRGISVGRTRYQEVRKRVEVRIRENDLVRQWGVVWSTNPR